MSKVQDQILASVGKQLTTMAGQALGNYLQGQFKTGRDWAYDRLTDQVATPNQLDHFTKGSRPNPTQVVDNRVTGDVDQEVVREEPAPGTMGGFWKRYGPIMEDNKRVGYEQTVRPTQVNVPPELNRETGKWEAYYDKKPSEYADWIPGFAYKNPETSAAVVGALNPIAQIGAATAIGAGIYNYSKPRSDYAVAVQDSAQHGGYNPNVEAAHASAMYRAQLEEQKFQHKMALMDARAQAATPGVQEYGKAVLGRQAPSGMSQIPDAYGMVNNIFSTPVPNYGV